MTAADGACGYVPPSPVRTPAGRDDGFWAGLCACGWESVMARATEAEAEGDAERHRAETARQGDPPEPLAAALAAWSATADALLGVLAGTVEDAGGDYAGAECTPADVLAGYPELAALIEAGRAWIITAAEHERRAAAYRAGGDMLTSELRRRLDAAWEILTLAETAGRTVPASALREALEGQTTTTGRPVTGGGPDHRTTEGNGTDGKR